MYTSPNMKLQVPVIGADNDPAWQSEIVYTFNKIDSHTHDGIGGGAPVKFNNINFAQPGGSASTPDLDDHPLTGLSYLGLNWQTTLLPVATYPTSVLQVNAAGDLYYITPSGQVLLSSVVAPATTAFAYNGFTGPVYQITGGNANYTGNSGATTTYLTPGLNTSFTYLSNIFTFVATTDTPSADSYPAANIAAATHYAVGTNSPGFYIYDLAAAAPVGGGQPPQKGYAAEFSSLGSSGDSVASSFQYGFRGRYAANGTDFSFPVHSFSVNFAFSGSLVSSTAPNAAAIPVTHLFNAQLGDGKSPYQSGDTSVAHFVNYSYTSAPVQNTPQNFMTYTQYSVSSTSGTMLGVSSTAAEAGYGMQFRYFLQNFSAVPGETPTFFQTFEAARQEYFWSDSNVNAGYRLNLRGALGLIPAFTLTAVSSPPVLQGGIGYNVQRSTYFPGPVLTPGATGFIWSMPLYVASTFFISPTQDNTSAVGQPAAHFATVYANAIAPSGTLSIGGNVAISGSLGVATTLTASAFVPTQQYTSGNTTNFGLYTNCRVVAAGTFTASGTGGSPAGFTGVTAAGLNIAGATGQNLQINSKNGFLITINLVASTPGPAMVLATIGSAAGPNDAFGVEFSAHTGPSQIQIGVINYTGVNTPTAVTVTFQLFQYGPN